MIQPHLENRITSESIDIIAVFVGAGSLIDTLSKQFLVSCPGIDGPELCLLAGSFKSKGLVECANGQFKVFLIHYNRDFNL